MVPIENGNVEEGVSAADRLAASLDGVTDSAAGPGGSGAGGAAGAVGKIKPQIDKVSEGMSKFKNSVSSAFEGLITGAMSFKEALSSVLKSLASIFAEKASAALFGSFNIPGFATGTSYAAGGLAAINERGGELVNLPRGSQVIPHDLSKRMIDRSGGGVVRLVIEEGPMFASRVRTEATGVAVEVTRKGISDNNRAQGDARYLRGGS